MQRKISLILQAWTAVIVTAGFSVGASAQTHYRFAHDQQLNSGYSVAYDIFQPSLNSSAAARWSSINIQVRSSDKSHSCFSS
jgi:hypothetical protein